MSLFQFSDSESMLLSPTQESDPPLHDLLQVIESLSPDHVTSSDGDSIANPASVSSSGSDPNSEENHGGFTEARNIDELFNLGRFSPDEAASSVSMPLLPLGVDSHNIKPLVDSDGVPLCWAPQSTPTASDPPPPPPQPQPPMSRQHQLLMMPRMGGQNQHHQQHQQQGNSSNFTFPFSFPYQQQQANPSQQMHFQPQQQQPFCVDSLLASELASHDGNNNDMPMLPLPLPRDDTESMVQILPQADGSGGRALPLPMSLMNPSAEAATTPEIKTEPNDDPEAAGSGGRALPLPMSLMNPSAEAATTPEIKTEPNDDPESPSSAVWSFVPRFGPSSQSGGWMKEVHPPPRPPSVVSSLFPSHYPMYILPSLPSAPLPREQLGEMMSLNNKFKTGGNNNQGRENNNGPNGDLLQQHSVSMTFAPIHGINNNNNMMLMRPPNSNTTTPLGVPCQQTRLKRATYPRKKERREPNRMCPLPWCAVRDCRNYNIKRHFVTRHLEREPRFHCPVCRAQAGTLVTFSLEQDVRRHLVNVHHMENLAAAKAYLEELRKTGYVVGQRDTSSATEGIKELLRRGITEFPGVGKLRKDEAERLHEWLLEKKTL